MIKAKIPYEFISQRMRLNWNDINFGFEHGLISSEVVINKATEQLCNDQSPPREVVELASLADNESVSSLISRLAQGEREATDEGTRAKWLYLILAWLFENRESLVDPLGLVEEIYSDFDYPRELAPFVRYMPIVGPDLGNREQNEARMFKYWEAYLDTARKRFAVSKGEAKDE